MMVNGQWSMVNGQWSMVNDLAAQVTTFAGVVNGLKGRHIPERGGVPRKNVSQNSNAGTKKDPTIKWGLLSQNVFFY